MPRRPWRPDLHYIYWKNHSADRLYGERHYGDPWRPPKSPGMLRQPTPHYELKVKPYQPGEKNEQTTPETLELMATEPTPMEDQLSALESEVMKAKKKDGYQQLQTESWWV